MIDNIIPNELKERKRPTLTPNTATIRSTALPSMRVSARESLYTSQKSRVKPTETVVKKANTIDPKQEQLVEEYKYERSLVQNINQWMDSQKTNQIKRLSSGIAGSRKESLSNQMMRTLKEGVNGTEEQFDLKQHYMTPQVNIQIINSIDNIESTLDKHLFELEAHEEDHFNAYAKDDVKSALPMETQEMKKLFLNKKLVNDFLLTKINKQQDTKSQSVTQRETVEKKAKEALASFKNLTTVIPHIQSVLKSSYSDAYKRLLDKKQFTNKIIDPIREKATNWEKQQKQFDLIVESQMEKLQQANKEIQEKKEDLAKLRKENFDIRNGFKSMNEKLDELQMKYQRKLQNFSNLIATKEYTKEQQMQLQKIHDQKEQELMSILNKINQQKKTIQTNNESILHLERYIQMIKEQKDHIRDELISFLKSLLKSEDLFLNDSLAEIVKQLLRLKGIIQSIDFPNYMDEESKNFLMRKANIELQLDQLQKQQQFESPKKQRVQSSRDMVFGIRPQFDEKMKELRQKMVDFKKENSHVYKPQIVNQRQKFQDNKLYKELVPYYSQPQLEIQIESANENKLSKINYFKEGLQKIRALEQELIEITQVEITRIKLAYQSKLQHQSIQVKVYTIVQALFGRKRMNEILQDIFGPQFLINLNAVFQLNQEGNKVNKDAIHEHVRSASLTAKQFQNHLSQAYEVNFYYDPMMNYTPQLRDYYPEGNFFVNDPGYVSERQKSKHVRFQSNDHL